MKTVLSLITLLTFFYLNSCIAPFLVGATAGGLIVHDNRDIQTIGDDNSIKQNIHSQIVHDQSFSDSHIEVSCFNHMILLTGQTPNANLKIKAAKIAQHYTKIKRVYNEIIIGNSTSMEVRVHDSWITTKIKSKLLATQKLRSGNIKVVTENGVVFLLGIVTDDQAQLAIDSIKDIEGVKKIVNAFQHLRVMPNKENITTN